MPAANIDIDLERGFIATVLRIGDRARAITKHVTWRDFATASNQRLWQAIQNVDSVGRLLITDWLKRRNFEEEVEYLESLYGLRTTGENVLALATKVVELAYFRRLQDAAMEVAALAMPNGHKANEVHALLSTKVAKLRPAEASKQGVEDEDAMAMFDEAISATSFVTLPPLRSPYVNLFQFGGLGRSIPRGKAVAIIAPSGGGKSTFTNGYIRAWTEDGYNVAVYSDEFTVEERIALTIQSYGGPSLEDFYKNIEYHACRRDGRPPTGAPYSDSQLALLKTARANIKEKVKGKTFHISQSMTMQEIVGQAKDWAAKLRAEGRRLDAIVIDYLQSVASDGDYKSEAERYNDMIETLMKFAESEQLAVIVVSQVNKESGREAMKRGEMITQYDMPYARSNRFKAIFGIVQDPNKPGRYILKVLKHNNGGKRGEAYFILDPQTMIMEPDLSTPTPAAAKPQSKGQREEWDDYEYTQSGHF